ncbi:MAG: hypothetical protein IJH37_05130 [Clostridia bacterium]|nr:hypothetical protein [Clostridia bacterium]
MTIFGNTEADLLKYVYGLIQYEYHEVGFIANQPKEKIHALLADLNELIKKMDAIQPEV